MTGLRIGVLARAEDRGIGIQTWEAWRHLPDARALIVDPGRYSQGFPQHHDRYGPDTPVVRWSDDQRLDEATVRDWLGAVDVVYAVETYYDPRMIGWATDMGVATVLHTNPELHKPAEAAAVTQVWAPTPWRMEHLPGAALVPYPVATERWDAPYGRLAPLYDGQRALKIRHVGGRAAYGDRNGTKLAAAASRLFHPRVDYVVTSQDPTVAVGCGRRAPTPANYWELYDGHLLLMPRRFGGLCLPIQEAAGAGMATIALNVPPAAWYPTITVEAERWSSFRTGSGEVPIMTAEPADIAAVVNGLSVAEIRNLQHIAAAWADDHSWTRLLPTWVTLLEHAHNLVSTT